MAGLLAHRTSSALLIGAILVSPLLHGHGALEAPHDSHIAHSAVSHPDSAAHIEATVTDDHFECSACLHRGPQTGSTDARLDLDLAPIASTAPATPPRSAERAGHGRVAPRGPPLALSS